MHDWSAVPNMKAEPYLEDMFCLVAISTLRLFVRTCPSIIQSMHRIDWNGTEVVYIHISQ